MDVQAIALPLVLITLTFIIITLLRHKDNHPKLPPGSLGWPVIGETIEFLFGKPEKFVRYRMTKYSPDVFKTKILGEKTAVICGPNGHKFLFSNEQKYFTSFRPHPMQHLFPSNRPKASGNPTLIPSTHGPPVEEAKAFRQPGFLKPEALMRLLGKMDSITKQQLKAHCSNKTLVEVNPLAKTITLTLACHFFLGISSTERIARLVKHFDDVTLGMHCLMINLPGTAFYRANKAANAIRKELASVIQEKKQEIASGSPTHDLLTYMVAARDSAGNPMDAAEVAMGLLTAGYATLSTTITFLMKYLGLNPEIYERVRAEQMEIAGLKKPGELLEWEDIGKMKYSWNVVCETMRMVPPLQGAFRDVATEFTYAGYTIPKGWKVYWTVSTTNMNPKYFKNPEKFNPSRYDEGEVPPPYTYVPFGGGPRMCPGKEYARLTILTFVHNVVKMYKWEVIDPNEKVDGDMMPKPQKGLPVHLFRH